MTRPPVDNERFLSRWSRLKRAQESGATAPAPVQPLKTAAAPAATASLPTTGEGGAPGLPPIESLTMDSDYGQFFQPKVPEALKRAAVKKLFTDPHFNIMDGLDTYIDDYTKSDPIPPEVMARLWHAKDLIDHPSNRKPEEVAEVPEAALEADDVPVEGPVAQCEELVAQHETLVESPRPAGTTGLVPRPVGWVERSDTHLPIRAEPVEKKPE